MPHYTPDGIAYMMPTIQEDRENHGVIEFISTYDLNTIETIFKSTNQEGIKALSDHYWLMSNSSLDNWSVCTITDILFRHQVSWLDKYYKMEKKYGEEQLRLFIHRNGYNIKKKLTDLINFAMSKVYQNDVIGVMIKGTKEQPDPGYIDGEESILDVFMEAIQDNYYMPGQVYIDGKLVQLIKKKHKEPDDNRLAIEELQMI